MVPTITLRHCCSKWINSELPSCEGMEAVARAYDKYPEILHSKSNCVIVISARHCGVSLLNSIRVWYVLVDSTLFFASAFTAEHGLHRNSQPPVGNILSNWPRCHLSTGWFMTPETPAAGQMADCCKHGQNSAFKVEFIPVDLADAMWAKPYLNAAANFFGKKTWVLRNERAYCFFFSIHTT